MFAEFSDEKYLLSPNILLKVAHLSNGLSECIHCGRKSQLVRIFGRY
jgi:hypothetical protein